MRANSAARLLSAFLVVALGMTIAVGAHAAVNRILLVGDSWTQYIWKDNVMQSVTGVGVLGADTAISGSTAAAWAANTPLTTPIGSQGVLDKISILLADNPSVDIVYMSLGGNDMWGQDNGGWTNGMDAATWAQHKATIKANVLAVINHCLAQRSNIRVVLAGYDYLNFWDTVSQDAVDLALWQFLGSPTPRQINDAFIEMGLEMRDIAASNPSRVAYVQDFGLMQNWKNSPVGAVKPGTIATGYNPYPGGNRDYPTPMGALAGTSGNRDAIHLSTQGYTVLVQNVYANVLQYLINNPYTPDTTAPVITILGSNPATVEAKTSYADAGATANDDVDGNITSRISVANGVNANIKGVYSVTYSVSDSAGNPTQATRTVYVVDTTKPVITLVGTNPVNLTVGATYTDAGATASDNYDGNITASIVASNYVNTSAVGVYTVSYAVKDSSGNYATPVTRTVNVVEPPDTTPPVLSLLGSNPASVNQNTVYMDAGATASDNKDGDISSSIVVTGTVDTSVLGTSTLTYNVKDAAGNAAAPVTRVVNVISAVVDTTAPVITMLGSSSITLQAGANYVDAGATATDNIDGNVTSKIVTVNPVNTLVLGTYYVTYNVTDNAGNAAVQKKRTVKVVDATKPVITLLGSTGITVNVFSTFTDPGATAKDNLDGDISANIVVTGSVNPNVVGTYYLYYNVKDSMGNVALQKVRTVKVADRTKPALTMLGTNPTTINVFGVYTEPGATAVDNYDGDLTSKIAISGAVNPNVVGTYYVTYSVKDAAGNLASAKRTVKVVDKVKPVIAMLGTTPVTVYQGSTYTDAGATATDNYDGDITAKIVVTNPVNTAVLGTYYVKYNVKDASNNAATAVTRVVKILAAPVAP